MQAARSPVAKGVGAVGVAEDPLCLKAGRGAHDAAKVGVAEGQALHGTNTVVKARASRRPAALSQRS